MSHTIVIFGASGDLTSRKLIPALYRLQAKRRLPEDLRIVGFSRTEMPDDEWRAKLRETTAKFTEHDFQEETWRQLAARIFYQPGDIEQTEDFRSLAHRLEELESGQGCTRIYYLATAPQFYETTVAQLGKCGQATEERCLRRIVIEKPFGADRRTARELNEKLHKVFTESQVYRIDHYLGKETVQNILVLRFANSIFEPLWNRNYVDHVQITAAEEVAVGSRGGYYDSAGVLRDMFQNHLLQLLTITAMEVPARFEADLVRNEKVKVLEAVRPLTGDAACRDTLRGQYRGYRSEPQVDPDSQTATYAAVKVAIENWRWQGVPFYLRSGKALSCRTTQIVIQFRQPPHLLFATKKREPEANRLEIHIQPAEGIQLHFQTKVPDAGMDLRLTDLDFRFDSEFAQKLPDAYERLLLDVLTGDASLFARHDEVELAWGIIDPILAAWRETGRPKLCEYERGLWGPVEALDWIARDGRTWLDACPVLH